MKKYCLSEQTTQARWTNVAGSKEAFTNTWMRSICYGIIRKVADNLWKDDLLVSFSTNEANLTQSDHVYLYASTFPF